MKHLIKIAISKIALWYTLAVGAQGDLPDISSLDSGWNAITTDGVWNSEFSTSQYTFAVWIFWRHLAIFIKIELRK